MSSIVGFHCVNEIKKTDSSVRLKMKNGTGTPCLRPVDMMRASSRPWGQFIPCRFRWFHKRRQIPLTSLQTFNLKKKKKKRQQRQTSPRWWCKPRRMLANPKHKENKSQSQLVPGSIQETCSTFRGAVLLTPRVQATSFRNKNASQLSDLGRWGLGRLVGNTKLWGSAVVFSPAITTSAQKDPEILS